MEATEIPLAGRCKVATRAIIAIYNEKGDEFCTIYQHWDGGPDSLGKQLEEFLQDRIITEGIPYGHDLHKIANGMYDLAAQIVSYLKYDSPVGNVYIYPVGRRNVCESFIYHVKFRGYNKPVELEVEAVHDGQRWRLM